MKLTNLVYALIVAVGIFLIYSWTQARVYCESYGDDCDYKQLRYVPNSDARFGANYCNPYAYKQPITLAKPNEPHPKQNLCKSTPTKSCANRSGLPAFTFAYPEEEKKHGCVEMTPLMRQGCIMGEL